MSQNKVIESSLINENKPISTLLFVDDEANILTALKRLFRPYGYNILVAEGGQAALELLQQQPVDLVISDMRMPGMDGAEFLELVATQWPGTIRILLTGYADLKSTIKAVNAGKIYRYISKPWEDNDITISVKHALDQKNLEAERDRLLALTHNQNEELKRLNTGLEDQVLARTNELQQTVSFLELAHESLDASYRTTVEVFSNLIEMREQHTQQARQLAEHAMQLGQLCGLDETELRNIRYAGLLRNIGKVSLSDKLLGKAISSMSESEHKKFIDHPIIGEGVLMALEPLHDAAHLIRHQYEQFNGKGCPDQLKGEGIPIASRILKIVGDYYDLQHGLIVPTHLNTAEAGKYLGADDGSHYDPNLVVLFNSLLGKKSKPEDDISESHVKSNGLQAGMVLSRDLVLSDKVLLLSKGHTLNDNLIERIHNMEASIGNDLDIYILNNGVN